MSDGLPTRSLVVSADLQRAVVRDASIYALTRASAVVMWAMAAITVVAYFVLSAIAPQSIAEIWWVFVLMFGLLAATVIVTTLSVRKAVRAAMPVGSELSAGITKRGIRVEGVQGRSEMAFSAYRALHVRGVAVMLRMLGSSAFQVLPRELFTEDELESLVKRYS